VSDDRLLCGLQDFVVSLAGVLKGGSAYLLRWSSFFSGNMKADHAPQQQGSPIQRCRNPLNTPPPRRLQLREREWLQLDGCSRYGPKCALPANAGGSMVG
jgi:hypothetical protein